MIVKITILLVVASIIYHSYYKTYLSNSPWEVFRLTFSDYCPLYVVIDVLLRIFSAIGIIASVIWLLFLRWENQYEESTFLHRNRLL